MKSPSDLAAQLYRKAGNDLAAARIGLEHGAPLDTVCFHVQQAAEKMLKSALAAKDLDYPFTHELHELIELAVTHYPVLEEFADTIPEYTEFAVRLRYDDLAGSPGPRPKRRFGKLNGCGRFCVRSRRRLRKWGTDSCGTGLQPVQRSAVQDSPVAKWLSVPISDR